MTTTKNLKKNFLVNNAKKENIYRYLYFVENNRYISYSSEYDMYLRFSRYVNPFASKDPLEDGVVYKRVRRCRRGEGFATSQSFTYKGTRSYAGKKSGVCAVC